MDGDLEAALPEILGSSPVMVGLRVRSLTKVTKCYEPLPGFLHATENCASQDGIDQIAREFLGFDPTEVQSNGLLGKASRNLALPLTDDSDIHYIDALRSTGTPPHDAKSVLQALLGLAAAIEADEWSRATGDDGIARIRELAAGAAEHANVDGGLVSRALEVVTTAHGPGQAAKIVDHAAEQIVAAPGVGQFDRGALDAAYPVAGLRPTALVTAATRGQAAVLSDPALVLQLAGEIFRVNQRNREFSDALRILSGIDSNEERALLLCEVLDTASHRLDAWLTSLATRRLAEQRADGVRGVVLGAYGFVRNIEIEPPTAVDHPPAGLGTVFEDPRDGGYVHAPSVAHATTAGVLRSARLTHDPGDSGSPALDIDLSSTRVRRALHVVDGIRQGQPLGALLGYRLERLLHEQHLDRFIYVLRSVAPLTAAKLTDHGTEPVPAALESVAAANVVDGVRLLEIRNGVGGEAAIKQRLKDGPKDRTYVQSWRQPTPAEESKVLAAIGKVAEVHDAVADLLLAEAVHHLVQGNTARAAAALDSAGGGDGIPPDPEVIRTPRSGIAFTHRLVVLTPAGAAAAGQSGWSDTAPRAEAHPQLEAWARAQLGPATRVVLKAQPQVTLEGHGLCALDVVVDAGPVLHDRVGSAPLQQRPAAWGRASDRLTLAEAEELVRPLREVLAAARPLTGALVAAPADVDQPPRKMNVAGLRNRAQEARDGLEAAGKALADAVATSGDIAKQLTAVYGWGVRPPAPLSALAPADLPRVGEGVGAEVKRRVAAADVALKAAADPALTLDADRVRALGDALTAVFGPGLPALPRLKAPTAADGLTAALAVASPNDAENVRPWLSRWASVRRATARYAETLLFREALGNRRHLRVAQLPANAFGTWVGLPFPPNARPPSGPVTSLVLELPPGQAPTGHEDLAGFVVDEWVDVVPRRITIPKHDNVPEKIASVTTTAAAVNAHAPSARPPQAILLAVTPDGQPWTIQKLVDVVEDTFRLAQERAVTLERVPLAPRIVPALYVNDWSLQGDPEPVLFVRKLLGIADLEAVPKFVKG
jgi:hypothetical protein